MAGMEDRGDTVTDNCSDAPVVRDLMIVDPAGYDVARQRCLILIARAQPPQGQGHYLLIHAYLFVFKVIVG